MKSKNQPELKISYVKKHAFKPMKPFKNLIQEAEFWDTHSAVDKIDDGTLVGFHAAKKDGSITVRFSQKDVQNLREHANHLGVGPTTLIRMWVLEKLRQTA